MSHTGQGLSLFQQLLFINGTFLLLILLFFVFLFFLGFIHLDEEKGTFPKKITFSEVRVACLWKAKTFWLHNKMLAGFSVWDFGNIQVWSSSCVAAE